ncbi:MAG: sulfur-oxidizing protein SoxB, partial [Burkholderiaceae bacterium]
MSIGRREFLQLLAVASAGGMALGHKEVLAGDMAA